MKNNFGESEIFHVFSRSIAEYVIFKKDEDYLRFIELLKFYKFKRKLSFSHYFRMGDTEKNKVYKGEKIVKIIAYCLMPTHIHLILSNEIENGISMFMKNVLDSYSRYFNTKMKRKGPLWESRFKSILVETDEQLLHLTRYIHLNPVTAYLVEKPENWKFSSYLEYLNQMNEKICEYEEIMELAGEKYRKFVEDGISYQRDMGKIKKLIFE